MFRRGCVLGAAAVLASSVAVSGVVGSSSAFGRLTPGEDAPPYAELFAVSGIASDDYWAVGARIVDHGADQAAYSEHWDGKAWREVPTPSPRRSNNDLFNGVVAVNANSVWAVGFAQPGFAEVAPFAGHWNGSKWTEMYLKIPKGSRDTSMSDVDATSDTDVWAVGDAGSFQVPQPLIEHWDGSRWSIVPPPPHQPRNGGLTGVRAGSADDVWAVGYRKVKGDLQPFAEHYDGTAWIVVDVPLPPGMKQAGLTDVAASASDDVWCVGTSLGRMPHPLIEHWDGATWHTERANVNGADMLATSITAVTADDVWVVGNTHDRHPVFTHWDGSAFHQVPVRAKAGTDLVDGVAFTSPGDGMAVGLKTTRRSGHRIVTPTHRHWNGHHWRDQG